MVSGSVCVNHTVALPVIPKTATPEQIAKMISETATASVNEAVAVVRERTQGARPVVLAASPTTTQVRGRLFLTVSVVVGLTADPARSQLVVPNGPVKVGVPS